MAKKTKVSVLLEEGQFRRFEAYCAEKGYKKSTLIARLIREHLDGVGFLFQSGLPFGEPRENGKL